MCPVPFSFLNVNDDVAMGTNFFRRKVFFHQVFLRFTVGAICFLFFPQTFHRFQASPPPSLIVEIRA